MIYQEIICDCYHHMLQGPFHARIDLGQQVIISKHALFHGRQATFVGY